MLAFDTCHKLYFIKCILFICTNKYTHIDQIYYYYRHYIILYYIILYYIIYINILYILLRAETCCCKCLKKEINKFVLDYILLLLLLLLLYTG